MTTVVNTMCPWNVPVFCILPYSQKIWQGIKFNWWFGGWCWNRQIEVRQYYFCLQRAEWCNVCSSALGPARHPSMRAVHIASSTLARCQVKTHGIALVRERQRSLINTYAMFMMADGGKSDLLPGSTLNFCDCGCDCDCGCIVVFIYVCHTLWVSAKWNFELWT